MSIASGVLVVDKPVGPTSHDIVAQARRLFRTKAIGHAGTLDPMASGVLLLLVGEATKLSNALTLDRKSYRATVQFGTATDSDDAWGTETERSAVTPRWLTPARLQAALDAERRRTEQFPPRVSAIKSAGIPAHRRHRRGESVELPAREIHVHELDVLNVTDVQLELSLTVSKGYYVRALARDLGRQLDMPAHLSALCRTMSGDFRLDEAVAWPCSEVPALMTLEQVARRSMPVRILDAVGVRRARLGQPLQAAHFVAAPDPGDTTDVGRIAAWLAPDGAMVALGQAEADGTHRVVRGFVPTT